MGMDNNIEDYSELENVGNFIDRALEEKGFTIKLITQNYIYFNIEKIMNFVNSVFTEFSEQYGWKSESKEYFLNPLNQKFKYSFLIEK